MTRTRLRNSLAAAAAILLIATPVAVAQVISVNNASGRVTQLGANVTPQVDETSCTMAPSLAATVAANQPNGGLVVQQFSPVPCTAATVVVTPVPPTPTPTSTTSSLAAGANAGTSPGTPTCIAGLTPACSFLNGELTITTGTSPSAGAMIVVTLPFALANKPLPAVRAANSAAASCVPYIQDASISTTGLTISCNVAPSAATALHFYYELTQR